MDSPMGYFLLAGGFSEGALGRTSAALHHPVYFKTRKLGGGACVCVLFCRVF